MIQLKRVYEPPERADGCRVLVDRLWPRGLPREKVRIDEWRKDLAPSDALRRWFGHDPMKRSEFKRRYRQELSRKRAEIKSLAEEARHGTITPVYGARDEQHNNAVVLKELLERHF